MVDACMAFRRRVEPADTKEDLLEQKQRELELLAADISRREEASKKVIACMWS